MLNWIHSGWIRVLPTGEEAVPWLMTFLRKYQKLRPQIADASLVYLAETEGIDTVFTLDRRDFSAYRYGKNRVLRILPR
jgi:predicted nucleic acid-binding protein